MMHGQRNIKVYQGLIVNYDDDDDDDSSPLARHVVSTSTRLTRFRRDRSFIFRVQ